jgi:hypothetical protein
MTRFEKCWGIYTGKRFGSKIARANRKEGDRVGWVWVQNRQWKVTTHTEATGRYGKEIWPRVRVNHGMAEVKLLRYRWLSPFLKLL